MSELNLPDRIKIYQHRKRLRGNWVGDWNQNGDVYIIKDLDAPDKLGILIHEILELLMTNYFGIPDCCSPGYHHDHHGELNEKAHQIASEAEYLILKRLGIDVDQYLSRMEKLRRETYKDTKEACKSCYKKKTCKQKDAL